MRRTIRRAMLAAAIATSASAPALSQGLDAAIAGVVRDASGAALPGVAITVTSLDRAIVVSAIVTADDGRYAVVALPPGAYSVTAELAGFAKQEIAPLTLQIADRVRIDLAMSAKALVDTARADGPSVASVVRDTTSVGETIAPEHLQQLPLFSRNPVNLMQLVGGVSGGTDPDGNLSAGQLSLNGSRTANTEVTVDGVSAAGGSTGDITFIPSIESLREVKAQTSGYSAEFGRTSGGTVSAIVQSGTRKYRGTVYGYARDSRFNANNYFNNSRGIDKPADPYWQYGASLGGPVAKVPGHTFFFFNYERMRRTLPRPFTATLPTDALRSGDLSAFETPILDPATGEPVRDPSRATPGNPLGLNIIPIGRIDPAARAIVATLPLPNLPGTTNNFVTVSEDTIDLRQVTTRVDRTVGAGARVHGRYSQQTGVNPGVAPDASAILPGPMNPGAGANHPRDRQVSIGFNQTLRPSLVHTAVFGAGMNRQSVDPPGGIDAPSSLGFARAPRLSIDGNRGYYAPAILFPNFNFGYRSGASSRFGMNSNTLSRQDSTTIQMSDAVTWIRGAHSMKAGAQLRLNRLDVFGGGDAFAGVYTINGDNLPGGPSNSQETQWAAFLFGLVDAANYTIPQPRTGRRNHNIAVFAQDDWKPTGRLTVNLGLRWEYESPLTIDNDIYSRIDVRTGELLVASVNASESLNLAANTLNLAPRAGVAWSVGARTVVRAAYGMFYSQLFSNLGGPGALYPGFTSIVQFGRLGAGRSRDFRLSDGIPLTGVPGTADPFAAERNAAINNPLQAGPQWASIAPLPHTHLWNAGIERQFPHALTIEASYVGSHGSHLPLDSTDFNAVPLDQWDAVARAASAVFTQSTRPFPTIGTLNAFEHIGRSNYHSGQFHLRRQFGSGVGLKAAYTLSRSKDDGSGIFNASQPNGLQRGIVPTFRRDLDYALSAFDRTHAFSLAANAELPLGAAKRWLSERSIARAIVGGFQVSALITAKSGLPATITETGINSLPLSQPRPDGHGPLPVQISPGPNGAVRYFPAPGDAGFPFTPVGPLYTGSGASRTQVLPVGLGDVRRNSVRGPSEYNVDLSVARRLHVLRTVNVSVRAEVFNLLNHTNLQLDPGGATTTLPVQVVDGRAQFVAPSFGLITSALPARRLQFVVRLDF